MVAAGKVMLSITVMPKTIHEKDPQGLGRAEKNSDPFCPEPEGRIKFSLNPFPLGAHLPSEFRTDWSSCPAANRGQSHKQTNPQTFIRALY